MTINTINIRLETLKTSFIQQYDYNKEIMLYSSLTNNPNDNYNSTLVVKSDTNVLLLHELDVYKFDCFEISNCTDYAIIKYTNNGHNSLYIFEFKKTIDTKSYPKIHDQFIGAYFRAIMIANYFLIDIHSVYLYIIYSKDKITTAKSIVTEHIMRVPYMKDWINSWLNKDDQVLFTYKNQNISFFYRTLHIDVNAKHHLNIF
jgi:hypothetical protein